MNVNINNPQTVNIITTSPRRKTWIKKWHAFGLHFYVSNGRMRRQPRDENNKRTCVNGQKRQGLVANARHKKKRLYEERGGKCELCGKAFDLSVIQVHHKMPLHYFPELASHVDNLLLVCPECHHHIHSNPLLMADMIRATAKHFNIENPEKRYGKD